LLQDADEFWVHRSGDLSEIVQDAKDDVFLLDRFNACLSESLQRKIGDAQQPRIEELDIFVQPLHISRMMMDANPSLRWISASPIGKVVARAEVVAAIAAGGHQIFRQDGNAIPPRRVAGAAIVHVPFSTERKIENTASLFNRNPAVFSGNIGWHWRRWVEIYRKGALRCLEWVAAENYGAQRCSTDEE